MRSCSNTWVWTASASPTGQTQWVGQVAATSCVTSRKLLRLAGPSNPGYGGGDVNLRTAQYTTQAAPHAATATPHHLPAYNTCTAALPSHRPVSLIADPSPTTGGVTTARPQGSSNSDLSRETTASRT